MSFDAYKERIEYGDTVIIYLGFDRMMQFEVEKGKVHQTKFGVLRHDSLVELKFGCKVSSTRGYFHVLHPSPELWTVNLPHRTQILYSTDISVVTLQLDLKPGSKVIESGTGSASLAHAMLRTIAPTGHLYTFDFHEKRVELAREEFKRHGFEKLATVAHKDVCREGFGLDAVADAVFLDLPLPWEAVPFAKQSLVPGGRLCSFSPCIEQVQRTCLALRDLGFTEIMTVECLRQPLDVRTIVFPVADLGYGGSSDADSCSRVKRILSEKPMTGHIEYMTGSEKCRPIFRDNKKLKLDDGVADGVQNDGDNGDNDDDDACNNSSSEEGEACDAVTNSTSVDIEVSGGDCTKPLQAPRNDESNWMGASYVFRTGAPSLVNTGHTGFLTFATLYPV